MHPFARWMSAASTEEKKRLAKLARTSYVYLYHLAAPEDSARHRVPDSDLAIRLEKATERMQVLNPMLPRISRRDLNPTCRRCEYAKACDPTLSR